MRAELARRIDALTQVWVADPAQPELSDADAHHLLRVLRARPGDEVVVTDGAGQWAFARVAGGGLEPSSELLRDTPDPLAVLYLSPLKGDHSEWAVAKATELGVTEVVPLLAARVAVRPKDGSWDATVERWRRVSRSAAAICRRTWDLSIGPPTAVGDVPSSVAVADFFGGDGPTDATAIAIGPEGGWAEGEWAKDRPRVGLGELVLRGDTAAVAAATLLVQRRPGWSRPGDRATIGNDEEAR